MAELDARTISPPLPRPYGMGTPAVPVIDAKSFPPGEDFVWLDATTRSADISEYFPRPSRDERGYGDGKAAVRRIHFPMGSYACAAELCSYPGHEKSGPAPYFLHWALIEAGFKVNIERSSITSDGVAPVAQKRFCQYCGSPIDQPHAADCPTLAEASPQNDTEAA